MFQDRWEGYTWKIKNEIEGPNGLKLNQGKSPKSTRREKKIKLGKDKSTPKRWSAHNMVEGQNTYNDEERLRLELSKRRAFFFRTRGTMRVHEWLFRGNTVNVETPQGMKRL